MARVTPCRSPTISHSRLLDPVLTTGPCLLAVAAPREAEAVLVGLGSADSTPPAPWTTRVLNDRLHLVVTGVGKSNAAGAVARALTSQHSGVLSLGLAGALPALPGLEVGQVMLADTCHLADEGLSTPDRFLTQSELGFPACDSLGERFPTDPTWRDALAALALRIGPCATVSTCSGTDARATEIARRTGALCEDMESAAVALTAHRRGMPFSCIRVISNQTGDHQAWDLELAFSVLARVAGGL